MKRIKFILPVLLLIIQFVNAQTISVTARGKERDTYGSRYFFNDWVHGFIIDSKDSLIKNPAFLFNYDKMGGRLVLTTDQKSLIVVNKEKVKSFTLFNQDKQAFVFERVPAIDTARYVQVLSMGAKYKIYKLIKTDYKRSDYSTDGVFQSGNKYNEYVDDGDYYLLNIENNQLQKIALKKKALETAFASDDSKLNKFMTDHSSDTIGDIYLTGLGDYMNN
jgi:hypothetical protein